MGSRGQFWSTGRQFYFLVPIPSPPMSSPKDTLGLGFGLRKNGTVRRRNPKLEAAVLEAKLGCGGEREEGRGSPEDPVCWHWPGLVYRRSSRKVLARKPCLLLSRTQHTGTWAPSGSTGSKHRETSSGWATLPIQTTPATPRSPFCSAKYVTSGVSFNPPPPPTELVLSFPIFRGGPEAYTEGTWRGWDENP